MLSSQDGTELRN